uniref:Titin n=1 Tax=Lates calcarifer TaxID=8187 RepID=A0A4W6C8Z7_LATCA
MADRCILAWSEPALDGGASITHYVLEKRETSRLSWTVAAPNIKGLYHKLTNLLHGNEYIFRVRAVNKYGVGDYLESEPVIARNPYKPPSAPGTPEASLITKDSMVLSWTAPEQTGGADIEGYHLEKRDKDSVRWTKCNRQKLTDTHFKVTGLMTDHFYEFRVAAENEAGIGDLSELSLFYRACDATTPPGPPHHPKVTDYTKSSPKTGDKWGTACTVKVPEATVPNLTPNEAYLFRVVAINEKGKSEPKDLGLPVVTKDVEIEPSVNLLFNTYSVKAGDDLTLEVPVRGRPKPVVSWKKDGLPLKQTSSLTILNTATSSKILIKEAKREHVGKYEITLANTAGTVTTDIGVVVLDKPGPPKAIKVDAVTSDSITLSWSPPEYDGGCSISNYIVEKRDTNTQEWQMVASNVARTCFKAGRLTHGAEYQFRIYAVNRYGKSTYLDSPGIVAQYNFKQPGPPSTPIVKLATNILWTKMNRGMIKDTEYKIVTTDTSTSVIVKDCIRRDSGQYALTLQNIAGAVTMPINCVIIDKPGPSAGPLQITGLTAEECTLSWGPPQEAGGADITHYVVEKRETSRLAWTLVKGDVTKTYFKVKGLQKGNEYIFRVLAVNKYGLGEALESDAVKVTDPYTIATAPAGVDVTAITGDSMTLTWCKPASDGGSPIIGYVIERREKTGMRWIRVNRDLVVECTTVATKLRKACEYDFRVYAENAAGLSPPSEPSATFRAMDPLVVPSRPTKPKIISSTKDSVSIVPSPPMKLGVVNVTKDSITIAWTRPEYDGGSRVTGYLIDAVEKGQTKWVKCATVRTMTHTIKSLREGAEYFFRVRAENHAGLSEPKEMIVPVIVKEIQGTTSSFTTAFL